MNMPHIQDAKWLSDVELLDTAIEPSESYNQPHMEVFFKKLAEASTYANISNDIINELAQELKTVVPWFLKQMPPLYLWSTSQPAIVDDILEIISGKVLSEKQVAERYNSLTQTCALIASGENSSATFRLVSRLSQYKSKTVRIFSTLDKKLSICEVYQSPYTPFPKSNSNEKNDRKLEAVKKNLPNQNPELRESFLNLMDIDYVLTSTVKQMLIDYEAVEYCSQNENAYISVCNIYDEHNKDNLARIDFAIKHVSANVATENVIGLFNRYNHQVHRIIANEIHVSETETYTVLHIIVSNAANTVVTANAKIWGKLYKSLKALAYVDHDDEFSKLLQGETPFSLNETNLVRAIANWVHIFLTKQNPYYYSLDRVSKVILNHPTYMELGIRYFRCLFSKHFQEETQTTAEESHAQLHTYCSEVFDAVEKNILKEGVNFLKNILKTNYFLVSKGGLTFRMNPEVLNKEFYPETPYGFFYMIGRNFRAFQVRYRDISRGGMRVVLPRSSGEYENALAGLFDETNGLASAQQLKNKDIPEGGSKCVLVVKPGGDKCDTVKAAVSGLLDLIITDKMDRLAPEIIDYYGKEEIIYLGPDENLTNDLIDWIIKHALYRKYKYAYAFMSSKPDFGINHKIYGVTSEGLNIYVDNVLTYLGLKNKNFRVKMTGGPDGDVAGNEMNILHREYGENCRLVAVADGYGAAFDPNGLEWNEILRLFRESKSIIEFDAKKLSSPQAFVLPATTKENMKIRDTLYATVEAEIFIPGGGRPYTVKESNWEKYLLPDGKPSSLAIIEGANIFFTKEARQNLVEKGVIDIKDSSANKAGVSCSSYEIIACLTLQPQEFAQIKDIYVQQVLDIIRANADREAKLLFREWEKDKVDTDLVKLSYEISFEINSAKDMLREKLMELSDEELNSKEYHYVIFKHCPAILVDKYKERILEKLPKAHKIAILSAYMASHLIYKEGLHWLEHISPDQMLKFVLKYMMAEKRLEKMVTEIESSGVQYKDDIANILRASGAKYLAMS